NGEVSAELSWADTDANLELYLTDESGPVVAAANAGQNPSVLSWPVSDENYQWRIRSTHGQSHFTLEHMLTPDEPVAVCAPISTLSCEDVVQETPIEFQFDGTD